MKNTITWVSMPVAILLAGCSTSYPTFPDAPTKQPPIPQTVQVYKSIGSVQCGDAGIPAPNLALQLVESGVSVSDASCGHDGMMRIAQCGAPDGAIAAFAIAQRDLAEAQRIGFSPLSDLPSAQLMPCNE